MKIIIKIAFTFILLITVSCASTIQYAKYYNPLDKPTEGLVKICVIKKSIPLGTMVKAKVYQDSTLIGNLGYKGFLSWESLPKNSFIIAVTENIDSININLQKGKTYYFKMNFLPGFLIARTKLSLIGKDEFLEMYKKLK